MEESSPAEHSRLNAAYEAFKTNMKTMLNNLETDWMNKGSISKPDTITAEVMESAQALNPEMLNTMLDRLNREIAFALGFPISLLDAHGTDLATSKNILSVMTIVMKGIQDQYVSFVQDIINEQFPEAKAAGVIFSFSELDPRNAKDLADVKKVHADVLKIFREIGASDTDIRTLSTKYELLVNPELGGEGLVRSEGVDFEAYSEAEVAMSGRAIARIMDDADDNPGAIDVTV
jgi:hypothetical protein